MNTDYWAVISAIHTEPEYRFVGDELKLARRMAAAGLLVEKGGGKFAVTAYGESCFSLDIDPETTEDAKP